tara:strand:- start:826 stop:1095 length:270 start_codon:yes stop_codon:yes gene_type:complete
MIEDKYIIGIAEAVESVRKVQNKIDNEPYRNHIEKVTLLNRDKFRGMTKYFVDKVSKRGKIELSAKSDEKFFELWDNGFQSYLSAFEDE